MSGVWSVRAKALMIGFSDMVNMAGKPMTLEELQEKVADKPEYETFFEKAVKEVLEKIECAPPVALQFRFYFRLWNQCNFRNITF